MAALEIKIDLYRKGLRETRGKGVKSKVIQCVHGMCQLKFMQQSIYFFVHARKCVPRACEIKPSSTRKDQPEAPTTVTHMLARLDMMDIELRVLLRVL